MIRRAAQSSGRSWGRRACALSLALLALTSCDVLRGALPRDDSSPAAKQNPRNERPRLQPEHINKALDALLPPLPKPLRILTVTALPGVVAVQVQNPQQPQEVHQYNYRDGKIDGPVRVKLLGKGSLKDNLFRPPSADPRMAEEALKNVTQQYNHPAQKLVMIRNLPESMDIQFRVHLDTETSELIIATDKHGRVLGPVVATPNSPDNSTKEAELP